MHPTHVSSAEDILTGIDSTNKLLSTTYEPQLSYPALVSFSLIFLVFGFLQIRINAIGIASTKRVNALKALRQAKSQQLSLSSLQSTSDSKKSQMYDEAAVQQALQEYEIALDQEERLRTIIPGVRIVAPNNPNQSQDDIAAAKQFLGRKLGEDASMNTNKEEKGLSLALTVLIILVGITQLGLLYFLSYDPLSNSALNSL